MNTQEFIKNFIQQHRHAFDEATPDAHGWKSIDRMLGRLGHADGIERSLMLNRVLLDTEPAPESVWNAVARYLDDQPAGLETFIRHNREAFDESTPDLRVWAGIEEAMPNAMEKSAKVVRVHWQRSLLRAAASVALLVVGMAAGMWYAGNANAHGGMALSEISAEYAEVEQYYQRDIATKQEKLATFTSNRDEDVRQDLQQLDNVMDELRRELADVPPGNREQVIRAMIDNYKAKASILQRVLESMEQNQPESINSRKNGTESI